MVGCLLAAKWKGCVGTQAGQCEFSDRMKWWILWDLGGKGGHFEG